MKMSSWIDKIFRRKKKEKEENNVVLVGFVYANNIRIFFVQLLREGNILI